MCVQYDSNTNERLEPFKNVLRKYNRKSRIIIKICHRWYQSTVSGVISSVFTRTTSTWYGRFGIRNEAT